jgi:PAS domain S-box-containing protein
MSPQAIARITLGYVVGATAWILLSDLGLALLWPDISNMRNMGIVKGLAFVAVTAILLFGLLRREHHRTRTAVSSHAAGVATLLGHFRDFANKVSDLVLLIDAQGKIVEANGAACEFLSRNRQALLGLPMKDIEIAPDYAGKPRPSRYESTLITGSRTLRRVTMDVLPLQVHGDAFEQIIARDADAAGRQTERQGERAWLETFFDLPFIGICITSPGSKRWVRFNDRLCEILGYSRQQLENLAWTEVTHPDDIDADLASFDQVMRGEIDGYAMDKRFIRRDGATVHASIDVRAVRNDDGSVAYFVATVQDISGRKRVEFELKREKELLQAIVDNVPVMVVRNRPGGQTWWLNRVCESKLGWRNEELEEVDFLSAICEDNERAAQARTFFHVANGTWREFRAVRRDGSGLDVSWTSVRLSDGSSVAIGIDMTEGNAFEAALGRQRDLYGAVSEIAAALLRSPPRDEILTIACRIAVKRGGLKCAWVTELDEGRHIARLVARAGDDGGYIRESVAAAARHPGTTLPAQRAVRAGAPFVADPFPGDEVLPQGITEALASAGVHALGCFPIREDGAVTALLTVGADSPGYFDSTVFGMLAELCDCVSFALENHTRAHERREALAAIAHQEEGYRMLFEANPLPMWVYDLETLRILAANDAALEEYGYTRNELLALTIADVRPTEEVQRLMENLRDRRAVTGMQYSGTWEHLRKDGSRFRVEITSHGLDFEGRDARLVMMRPLRPA